MANKALGKGLSALIPGKSGGSETDAVAFLSVAKIKDNPFQPRQNYDDEKMTELKNSIREKGVLQPIVVRPQGEGYEVVAGERRLKAARDLSLEEIPVIVKDLSDEEAIVIALVENIQREELNPIEEAQSYCKLIDEFNVSQEELAQSLGKDRSTISNMIRLLKLPQNIQEGLFEGRISIGHARALLSLDKQSAQNEVFEKAVRKKLSVREIESLIKKLTDRGSRHKRGEKTRDPQIIELEEQMQKYFGTKVRIDAKKKRGTVHIDFYSPDDLKRIIKLMLK